jgi:SAM-dependent methyltransferase
MLAPNSNEVTYNPRIFDVVSEAQARSIILTPEGGCLSHQRWETETPYLINLILSKVRLTEDSFVLDYGCGIGRLARELISRTGCRVVGVDISPSMRGLASPYVYDDFFFSCSPAMLDILVNRNKMRFDLAISVWVLQHCFEPQDDLNLIYKSLVLDGKLFVVNNERRVVPTLERGWVDDGIDIKGLIKKMKLIEQEAGALDPEIIPKSLVEGTFWMLCAKKK